MTLAELKVQLGQVEDKISALLTTAASYNITGSHSVNDGALDSALAGLRKQEAILRRRIFRFQGYTSRTSPDFNATSKTKDYDN